MVYLALVILIAIVIIEITSKIIKIPSPVLLVIAGSIIGFLPGIPAINIPPEIMLLIFLPPLLFGEAWTIPKRELFLYRRPVGLLSIGLVVAITFSVGYATHYFIPDIPLFVGFILGAILSPTDAVAVSSIIEKLRVPQSISIILRGESLINDASGLVAFKFALLAATTGYFSPIEALNGFALVTIGGITIGFLLALSVEYLGKFLARYHLSNYYIEISISLISPFIAYISAEHFQFSGIIAVVVAGLYSGWKDLTTLSHNCRSHLKSVWATLLFLLNGIMFILLGLHLPVILQYPHNESFLQLFIYAVIIFSIMLVTRIIWTFCGAYIPRYIFKSLRVANPNLDPFQVFIVAWGGMRGTITVIAAFSIPLNSHFDGARNLIIHLAFIVTIFSLLVQGLSLPWIIKKLKVQNLPKNELHDIKLKLVDAAINKIYYVEANHEIIKRITAEYQRLREHIIYSIKDLKGEHREEIELRKISLEAEKDELLQLYKNNIIDEEVFKKIRDEIEIKLKPIDNFLE